MKKVKKLCIFLAFVVVTILGYSTPCFASTPALTPEQQAYLATYVRTYVSESSRYGYVQYDTMHGTELSCNNMSPGDGKVHFSCASFCATMLYQALDAKKLLEDDLSNIVNMRATGFFNPAQNSSFNSLTDSDVLMPGDIITYAAYRTHALIYIGYDPETGVHQLADVHSAEAGGELIELTQFAPNTPISYREFILRTKWGEVVRIDPSILPQDWQPEMPITIEWPDGRVTVNDGNLIITEYGLGSEDSELWYQGIGEMVFDGEVQTWLDVIVDSLGDILDYIVGVVTLGGRFLFIGAAQIAETLMNWILQIFSANSVLKVISVEDIIFNRVPLLNINLIRDLSTEGLSQQGLSIIETLRNSILMWYYIFRYIVIIGMLLSLIYMGVKMAISVIAEEKAKYKKMLLDWLVSFIMVFIIHYYIIVVINLNEFFVGIFEKQAIATAATMNETEDTSVVDNIDWAVLENDDTSDGTSEDASNVPSRDISNSRSPLSTQGSLFQEVRNMMYSLKFTEGWLGVFAYLILIYYTIKFCIKYVIRMFNIFILVLLGPLIAMSYSVDKIKDGKSQSLSKWMKELGFGVLVQSIHALIYTIFVSLILTQIQATNLLSFAFALILMFVTFNFMDKAEGLFESIFNVKADSITSTNETPSSLIKKYQSATALKGFVGGYWTVAKEAGKKVAPLLKPLADKTGLTKLGQNVKAMYNEDKYGDGAENKDDPTLQEEIKQEKEKAKKAEEKLKAQRKAIRKETTKALMNFVKAVPAMAENPMTSVTLILAGVTGIQKTKKMTSKFKSDVNLTSKVDMYEKVKLLNKKKNLQIQLRNQVNNAYNNPSTILGKQFSNNVEEAKVGHIAQKMLVDELQEELVRVDRAIVERAVNESFLENNGEINETALERIAKNIEEKTKRKIEKEELEKNMDGALAGMLAQKAMGKGKKKSTNADLTDAIKQAKEKLKKELKEQAQNSKMSKKEKRENLERGLKQELEAYIKEQQNKNELLKELKVNDITNLITEAINAEGSILRQLDGNGTKSTSNESTNTDGGNPLEINELGVHSNVEMQKGKDKPETESTDTTSLTNVGLKETELNQIQQEISPILETAAELRMVESELERNSVKVRKENIKEIVGEISRNTSGSVEHQREKAKERSNTSEKERRASNVTKEDKKQSKKQNNQNIRFKS